MQRLAVEGIRKRFGTVEALRDATMQVHEGEIVGIIGPNGAGKTTLLECIAGLTAADAGEVRDASGGTVSTTARRSMLLYLPDGIAPWPDQPVDWVLEFAGAVFGGGSESQDALIAALALDELRGQRIGALSKGQRKRVLLALALSAPQPTILMDEPFDGLDLRQTREAIALFREIARAGRSLVLSIHSMTDAMRVCDRLVLLSDGRTVAQGTLDELRAHAGAPDADLEEVFLGLT